MMLLHVSLCSGQDAAERGQGARPTAGQADKGPVVEVFLQVIREEGCRVNGAGHCSHRVCIDLGA